MPKGHKGAPRTPGSGRKKGTPNRKTQTLEAFFDSKGIYLPEKILEVSQLIPEARDQIKVWLELMQYLYPKRKAHEHEFKPTDEQLAAIVLERLNGKDS